jgi:hypothetical protein
MNAIKHGWLGCVTIVATTTGEPSFAFAVPSPGRHANCSGANGSRCAGSVG